MKVGSSTTITFARFSVPSSGSHQTNGTPSQVAPLRRRMYRWSVEG